MMLKATQDTNRPHCLVPIAIAAQPNWLTTLMYQAAT